MECHACRGYILGGLMWFAVPFTLATTLGLTGLALDLPLSVKEVSSGLVPPAVAYHLFGKGGVILITIMVFMVRDISSQMREMTILRVDGNIIWSWAEYQASWLKPRAKHLPVCYSSRKGWQSPPFEELQF